VCARCQKGVVFAVLCIPLHPDLVKFIKSGMLRLAGYVVRMQVIRNVYEIFVGKPEWKRRLGTPWYTW
jgi:hypothetical protein